MKTPIQENELENLLNFIGYGSLEADVWFLGLEENGWVEQGLEARVRFEQVEDLLTARNLLGLTSQKFAESALPGAWQGMCEIMLRLEKMEPTQENIRVYLQNHLGRSGDSTLVASLFPLPQPAGDGWNYNNLLPSFDSREDYYASVKRARFDLFRDLIREFHPKLVLAYGRQVWPDFESLFKNYSFTPSGKFQVGWDSNTVAILCDHFSVLRKNGMYDELLGLILENCLSIETSRTSSKPVVSKAEIARLKKEAARQVTASKRKSSAKHNPSDPYCVCAYCLGYENE